MICPRPACAVKPRPVLPECDVTVPSDETHFIVAIAFSSADQNEGEVPTVGPTKMATARPKPGFVPVSFDGSWSRPGIPVVPASSCRASVVGSVGREEMSKTPVPPPTALLCGRLTVVHETDGLVGLTRRPAATHACWLAGEANWAGLNVRNRGSSLPRYLQGLHDGRIRERRSEQPSRTRRRYGPDDAGSRDQ